MTVGGKTYSFAETERLVRAAARGLAGNGIGHRDFLALMLPNTAEFIIGWYAACLRGAAMVPINPPYRGFMLDAPLREPRTPGPLVHPDPMEALNPASTEVPAALARVASLGGAG